MEAQGEGGLPRATESDLGSRDSRPSARSPCRPPAGVSAAAVTAPAWPAGPSRRRGTGLPGGAHLLAVRQVDAPEQRVVFRPRLPRVVLVQEDRRAAHLQADLLDALLVVDGDQEGLAALLGFHSGENGEVLGERRRWNRGRRSDGSREGPGRAPDCSLPTGRLRGLATWQHRAARSKLPHSCPGQTAAPGQMAPAAPPPSHHLCEPSPARAQFKRRADRPFQL